jgi:hypothetical protein
MRGIVVSAAVLLCATAPARAQSSFTPEMAAWTSRTGQMLYSYHAAHDVAVAAIRERAGSAEIPPLYAGGPYDDGWAFSFGALEGDSAFVIRYGVIVSGGGEVKQFDAFSQRRVASPFHTAAARALAAVREDFERHRAAQHFDAEAYRFAVLPLDGGLTAFVSPAQTRPGVTLAGSDQMYEIGRGSRIQSTIRFHGRVIALPLNPPPHAEVAVLIVPDAPAVAPTDVLVAMERRAPLLVVFQRAAYLIAPDGSLAPVPEDDARVRAARAALDPARASSPDAHRR